MKIISLFIVVALFTFIASANAPVHNTKLPIEITSDELEYLKTEQQAIFSGNVRAVQGELDVRSDAMLVYYDSKKDQIGKVKNTISRLETNGNVQLITPKETAKSDYGVFNVDENVITLTGKVVLNSGKNMVKGDKFVYNVATGQSKIISGTQESNGDKQRVRGVFAPNGVTK